MKRARIVKDRVFRSALNGSLPSGPTSWFALSTDDPAALVAHLRDARGSDIRDHFARGDFEKWLTELYRRPDLAAGVRRLRESWNGEYVPRNELIALIESNLRSAS
jgi:hypothetical protein